MVLAASTSVSVATREQTGHGAQCNEAERPLRGSLGWRGADHRVGSEECRATLARDAAPFCCAGYAPDHLSLWDCCPQTMHVESVARLTNVKTD